MLAAVAECGLTVSATGPRPVKRACETDAAFRQTWKCKGIYAFGFGRPPGMISALPGHGFVKMYSVRCLLVLLRPTRGRRALELPLLGRPPRFFPQALLLAGAEA